jgi:hypothetical protein
MHYIKGGNTGRSAHKSNQAGQQLYTKNNIAKSDRNINTGETVSADNHIDTDAD